MALIKKKDSRKLGNAGYDHPERRKEEIWITNSRQGGSEVGWKTKRVGSVALDTSGNPVNGLCPVFAQKSEVDKGLK